MKEDVGMLKPKKHANKVGRLTWDAKLNKLLPYNPTEVLTPLYSKIQRAVLMFNEGLLCIYDYNYN